MKLTFNAESISGLLVLVVIALLFSPNVGRLLDVAFPEQPAIAQTAMTPTQTSPPTVVIPPSAIPSATHTPLPTDTPPPTVTPSLTSTLQPTKVTWTPSPVPSATPTPTATPTAPVIITVIRSPTPMSSKTPTPTKRPRPTPEFVPRTGNDGGVTVLVAYQRGLAQGGMTGAAIGLILAGALAAAWLSVTHGNEVDLREDG